MMNALPSIRVSHHQMLQTVPRLAGHELNHDFRSEPGRSWWSACQFQWREVLMSHHPKWTCCCRCFSSFSCFILLCFVTLWLRLVWISWASFKRRQSRVWRPTSPSWSSKVLPSCRTWSTFLGNHFHIGSRRKTENNQDTVDLAKHVLRPLDILNPIWYYQKISGQTVEGSRCFEMQP